jgi:predicted RNA-binding Zn ribbon-like protein
MRATRRVDDGLDRLLAVVNTRHGPEGHAPLVPTAEGEPATHDHLSDATEAVRFLRRQGAAVPRGVPDSGQLAALRRIRDAVLRLVDGDRPRYDRRAVALLRPRRYGVRPTGELTPAGTGWDGFADELVLDMLAAGHAAERLRYCANPACRWVYLDTTKNQNRRWCETATCADRMNVRRFRARQRSRRARR